jgi:hypothetical protein
MTEAKVKVVNPAVETMFQNQVPKICHWRLTYD